MTGFAASIADANICCSFSGSVRSAIFASSGRRTRRPGSAPSPASGPASAAARCLNCSVAAAQLSRSVIDSIGLAGAEFARTCRIFTWCLLRIRGADGAQIISSAPGRSPQALLRPVASWPAQPHDRGAGPGVFLSSRIRSMHTSTASPPGTRYPPGRAPAAGGTQPGCGDRRLRAEAGQVVIGHEPRMAMDRAVRGAVGAEFPGRR